MKPWWKSKTLWLNSILAGSLVVEANIGLIKDHIGPSAYLGVAGFAAFANAFLRFLTTQPLGKEDGTS